jgi:NarL family two-component system sensor histidine kinase LiaS
MSIRWTFLIVCGGLSLASAIIMGVAVYTVAQTGVTSLELALLAGLLAALAVGSMWIGYTVVQPLRRRLYELEEAASLIASGRLQHRVQTMGDTDELGRVAEQFNEMGDRIERQVRALQQLAEENRALAAEAEQAAALRERQRLARELHDSVSQQLFALTMLAGSARRQYENGQSTLAHTLQQLADLANAAQREMRALLLHLRPVELEGRSLKDAVAAFLSAVEERHQLRCQFEYQVDQALGTHIEEEVFRILQEAVANVLKHAEATEIVVRVVAENRLLHIAVLDDGKGIDDTREIQSGSYGIRAMHERARALGGSCNVFRRERGTAVEVNIPIFGKDGGADHGQGADC